MNKRGNIRKFGRKNVQRRALLRSLITALVSHGKIKTTKAKAKSLKVEMEKLTTLAKKQNLASRRLVNRSMGTVATDKLISEIALKLGEKRGGYVRIINLGQRRSDGAEMALIEFTS
ncbi:MAG: 50S ribosomal protein L17 [Candidatus Yanofskybacteria bacterium RIFCSPHIGHO2_01_FULL_45_42]|uniref:50S ribosomal protein L17 n=3 Tax=Candidatus Yanofskyibacteriota TaxID=1752733 RepID=A0A1F8F1K0_9BACT|nr:MAG: 50S ribosomal protein L17 [Candidatus Yanofskybacteria bacterium RIFCSPHIGHO2_01_FULL_45_42]OGN16885.1 MAG: 50S ribosomal protein L17 [Candidatus Yanofskybacteria bacterium RIFCSPHIGHO2_02_FULL_46_19]OGN27573.1 MAG: 50S ribosomal protein L17 [Candidatus Yanofskybacteria bacterium RIFCSPLOWO2_01_FULL_45_72]OGN32038.1 MAG: 50S ribosomal protein L17 [Candidatus Yanofskybacteria bacterium RIFCSPLOWO2_02_FULL_45_18]